MGSEPIRQQCLCEIFDQLFFVRPVYVCLARRFRDVLSSALVVKPWIHGGAAAGRRNDYDRQADKYVFSDHDANSSKPTSTPVYRARTRAGGQTSPAVAEPRRNARRSVKPRNQSNKGRSLGG